jgi:hypothetical protein
MSAVDAVTAVWNRLKTVDGVGPNVYNMLREAATDLQFNQLFVDATTDPSHKIVRAWRVTRTATQGRDETMAAMSRTHTVEISGFMSYQDGVSEPIFQQLVEDVCTAFDSYADGSARRRFVSDTYPQGEFEWSGPTQVLAVRLGTLGSVLVHAALLNYPVHEYPL